MVPINDDIVFRSLTGEAATIQPLRHFYNFKRQKRLGNLPEFPEHTPRRRQFKQMNL